MPGRRQPIYDRLYKIAQIATGDAEQLANRMYYASRAIAAERFLKIWPRAQSRNSHTRRALQRWYMNVFEEQLAEPITGQAAQAVDGSEAGRALLTLQERLHVPNDAALRVITALARDSQAVAADLAIGRAQLIEAGLAGRISTLFPRIPNADVGVGQAIAEQWYARAFRATIDPKLFAQPTTPLSPAEVHLVSIAVATGQPRILHADGNLIQPAVGEGMRRWREQVAWDWQNRPVLARERWLRREGFGPGHVLSPFAQLPGYLQVRLLGEAGAEVPTAPIASYAIPSGSVTEQAAAMFNAPPITPATRRDLNAHRLLFSRRAVTMPVGVIQTMPDLAPVIKAIKRLAAENRGSRQQMTGYARAFRLTDEKLAAAVSMHSSGALYKDIAADLGVTPRTLRQHLKNYEPNRNEPDFTGPGPDAVADRPGRAPQKERDSERILRQQQEQVSTPATSPTKGGAMTEAARRAKAVSDHGTAGRPVGNPSPAADGGRPDTRTAGNPEREEDRNRGRPRGR